MMLPAQTTDAVRIRSVRHTEHFASSVGFDGWDLQYTQLSPGCYQGESREVKLNDLQIYTESWNATVHQCGTAWPNSYVFAIPYEMTGDGRLNGQHLNNKISAFRGESAYDALVPPMKLLVVCVARDTFSEYLSTVEHVSCQGWLSKGMQLFDTTLRTPIVTQTLRSLVDECCKHPELIAHPEMQASMLQTTMQNLAPLVAGNVAPPQFAFGSFNHTQIVRRAREFALSRIDEPLQIIDVCRALRVSRRLLQYSFQDVLDINPVNYLRLLRLNGARRDLINSGEKPVNVQTVLARWGFWHGSRFSAEYKKMYNELPSETLRRVAPRAPAN